MLLTLILCGLFYLYSYVSLNLQTSDNLLYIHLLHAFPTYGRHTLGFALRATVCYVHILLRKIMYRLDYLSCMFRIRFANASGQAFGLLVPVSCIHYCTSTSGLSTR